MTFVYTKKENYSQSDIDTILEQHQGFVSKGFKDFVPLEKFNEVQSKLKPYLDKEREVKLTNLIPDNANKEYAKDIIKLADISEDDEEKVIIEKLSGVVKSRKFFTIDSELPPELKKDKPVVKDTNKEDEQEIRDLLKGL